YVAVVVHAGVDWDWELSAVTFAGLLCGMALLIAARDDETREQNGRSRHALAGLAAAVAVLGFVGLLGNIPASRAGDAIRARNWAAARSDARTAIRWAPWSADGWRRLGQSELGLHQLAAARRNLRIAIRKDPNN